MGFPIHLKNSNYERAKFQFNFCIMITETEYDKNSLIYELLLKKVAKTFETFEIDSEFEFIAENRDLIFDFFEKLYESLTKKEETISINITLPNTMEQFYFFFKFIDFSKAKTEILPYQVPVWLKYIDEKDLLYFECSVRKIIEQIDGISHVRRIAIKLDYELSYVIYVLYNLAISDCITLVDIFQFSNIYRATTNLKKFYNSSTILSDFKKFSGLNLSLYKNKYKHKNILKVYLDEKDLEEEMEISSEITNDILFSMYCELTNSTDVSEFLYKIKNYKINILLFVAFGIYKKILRRVHIYGICKKKEYKENFEQGSTDLLNIFLGLLDGRHCLDEVCCETNKTLNEVLTLISSIKESTIIYK